MKNIILFDNSTEINFNNSYLVNYYINNSVDDTSLLSFRIAIKHTLNMFLNIKDDNYSYIDLSTNDFKINSFELESLNSSFLSNIVCFEKSNSEYKLIFKKGNSLSSISFETNNLKIAIKKQIKKDYFKKKKYNIDSLMLM